MLAIIADTHMPKGARALPRDCVDRLAEAELILHAGDFCTATTLAEIETIGPQVLAVHGNVDDEDLHRSLPGRRVVQWGEKRIGMVHDGGRREGRLARLREWFPDADAVVFGHSHLPLHESEEGFSIFNPGSPTERRRAPTHTMGIASLHGNRLLFSHVDLTG